MQKDNTLTDHDRVSGLFAVTGLRKRGRALIFLDLDTVGSQQSGDVRPSYESILKPNDASGLHEAQVVQLKRLLRIGDRVNACGVVRLLRKTRHSLSDLAANTVPCTQIERATNVLRLSSLEILSPVLQSNTGTAKNPSFACQPTFTRQIGCVSPRTEALLQRLLPTSVEGGKETIGDRHSASSDTRSQRSRIFAEFLQTKFGLVSCTLKLESQTLSFSAIYVDAMPCCVCVCVCVCSGGAWAEARKSPSKHNTHASKFVTAHARPTAWPS